MQEYHDYNHAEGCPCPQCKPENIDEYLNRMDFEGNATCRRCRELILQYYDDKMEGILKGIFARIESEYPGCTAWWFWKSLKEKHGVR